MNSLDTPHTDDFNPFDVDPIRIPPDPEDPIIAADPASQSGLDLDYMAMEDHTDEGTDPEMAEEASTTAEPRSSGVADTPADPPAGTPPGYRCVIWGGMEAVVEKYLKQGLKPKEIVEQIYNVDKLLTSKGKKLDVMRVHQFKAKIAKRDPNSPKPVLGRPKTKDEEPTAPKEATVRQDVMPEPEPVTEEPVTKPDAAASASEARVEPQASGATVSGKEVFGFPSDVMDFYFRSEVSGTKDAVTLSLEGFGLTPNNLSIMFVEDQLLIEGPSFTKMFPLLPTYNRAGITAAFIKGALTVTIPRTKVVKTGTVEIKVVG
jgi:HSP20 family molecular chaperone IbpA